jgi:hypothetical protein
MICAPLQQLLGGQVHAHGRPIGLLALALGVLARTRSESELTAAFLRILAAIREYAGAD